jgi:hypothetical protein
MPIVSPQDSPLEDIEALTEHVAELIVAGQNTAAAP